MELRPKRETGLSSRGLEYESAGAIRSLVATIWEDSYNQASNPNGTIDLGTSENYIMNGNVAAFIKENVTIDGSNLAYGNGPWGSLRLRTAMVNYMQKYFSPLEPVDPDDLLFSSGCTSLCEMLGFSLFEPGDVMFLSRPIYQAFQGDFGRRAAVKSTFVSFKGTDQFGTEGVSCYESAINEAVEAGNRIRAILLCNPHNPLGRCYSAEALIEYMKLCEKYSIHLILDEVYATSVYDDDSPFTSILAIDSKKYINTNYLHLLYGFSKDLAGGGLRLGCVWTKNSALIAALSAISFFNWPSNISDTIGSAMLENEDWMASFREQSKKRLAECAAFARSVLDEYEIPYEKGASAGFFLWLDVRKYLSNDIEKTTWSKEQRLRKAMQENRVNLTPGEIMFSEGPGFFRLCFVKEEYEVREGLKRFKKSLLQIQATDE